MTKSISRSHFLKTVAAGSLGAGLGGKVLSGTTGYATAWKNTASSYKIKGFHIDLRSEVMTIEALKLMANSLSKGGINAIIMEYEATYPYQNHVTLYNANTYTREQIHDYVTYCQSLGIEVIPLQECLGHVQYILRHDRYAGLRVQPGIISQIDPLNPDAVSLFTELIDDLADSHPSGYMHIGGDEVRHLKNPKFASFVKKHGISGLYTRYMKKICKIVIDHGKTPLLWADMILAYPESINDLPVDKIIFIDWNYGWDINMFGNIADLQKKGCRFWGAPALRSSPDNYNVIRWGKHFNNLRDYIPYTRRAGYEGIVMTSWSTSGEYGYKWDDHNEVLDMFPIRNVYPLSGFRILREAYIQAIKNDKPLDPHDFVKEYAKQHFGLNSTDAKQLWRYLAHKQALVILGKPDNGKTLQATLDEFMEINGMIQKIDPTSNQKEFEHFKLMGNIRVQYLQTKLLQQEISRYKTGSNMPAEIKKKLKNLQNQSRKLELKFNELNNDFLKKGELKRLNGLRNEELESLWNSWSVIT